MSEGIYVTILSEGRHVPSRLSHKPDRSTFDNFTTSTAKKNVPITKMLRRGGRGWYRTCCACGSDVTYRRQKLCASTLKCVSGDARREKKGDDGVEIDPHFIIGLEK